MRLHLVILVWNTIVFFCLCFVRVSVFSIQRQYLLEFLLNVNTSSATQ